jgi:hypothetical protein
MSNTNNICVRVPRSHRKLGKFEDYLKRKSQYFYSFRFEGNFVYITGEEYERVRHLVTRARVDVSKLLKRWS